MSVNLGGMQSLSIMMGSIDYSQIVQQLYQTNRAPGDAMNQTIQNEQLKSNDWSQISTMAGSLQDALVTLASTQTFNSFTTTVTGTDSGAITATATTGATAGTYNITTTTGKFATQVSANPIGANPNLGTTQMSNLVWSQPITQGNITVVDGTTSKQISVVTSDTINSIIGKINTAFGSTVINSQAINATGDLTFTNSSASALSFGSAGDTSNFLQVIGLAGVSVNASAVGTSSRLGHVQLNSSLQSGNFNTPIASGGTITINGVGINYALTDTLQTVINNINSSTAGVTASYNPLTDEMTMTSKTSQAITVADTSGNLGAALGLNGTSAVGTPWNYTVNGGASQSSVSPTVTNAIPGVSFTIQSNTTTPTGATLTVAANTSTLTTNVNNFINAFNALYKQLQSDTAKGAALQGDAAMAQLGFRYMNDVLSNNLPNVPSAYANDSVMEIGISNGTIGSAPGTTNSLQVDTNALTTAFQNDPNKVMSLLQGMATKLNNELTNLTGQFNTLTPITSINANMVGIGQSEQNMYTSDIQSLEQQQQTIYDQATQQEQQMSAEFTQLQQYQAQVSIQQNALKAMLGTVGG